MRHSPQAIGFRCWLKDDAGGRRRATEGRASDDELLSLDRSPTAPKKPSRRDRRRLPDAIWQTNTCRTPSHHPKIQVSATPAAACASIRRARRPLTAHPGPSEGLGGKALSPALDAAAAHQGSGLTVAKAMQQLKTISTGRHRTEFLLRDGEFYFIEMTLAAGRDSLTEMISDIAHSDGAIRIAAGRR